ncbi:MOSC domain-containing protein [Neisseriaceae bacterium TC5R-5]|nr:MOSC domain-containing protein [Neisseriaceae bacterium TC5R-5]
MGVFKRSDIINHNVQMEILMQLINIFVHPLKSGRGIAYSQAFASRQGLLHDRAWLLATPDGNFITARTHPQLVLLETELIPGGLLLKMANKSAILAMTNCYQRQVRAQVWKDNFSAWHGDTQVDNWLSELMGEPCQLLWLGQHSQRLRGSAQDSYPVSFADGYPYLLVNQASLNDLNRQLKTPVTLRHFRPNLVVNAAYPWEEDEWKSIQIGNIIFDVAKPCTRCTFITINPDSAIISTDNEPLETLIKTHSLGDGVCFGLNLIPRNEGILKLGDPVQILENQYVF